MNKLIQILQNEYWYPCVVNDGYLFPLDSSSVYSIDFSKNDTYNQISPLLLSSSGRFIYLKDAGKVSFHDGVIEIDAPDILLDDSGTCLKDAQQKALESFKCDYVVDTVSITAPQLNTWIALGHVQKEDKILSYAESYVASGNKPGVIMIDDGWQIDNGSLMFNKENIPHPKDLINRLHKLGFKVMFWICPYVSKTNANLSYLIEKDYLVKTKDGNLAEVDYFDGVEYAINFNNPDAKKWFKDKCDDFKKEYNVDGFKLDCGDEQYFTETILDANEINRNYVDTFTEECNDLLIEVRTVYKHHCKNIIQRLSDKCHCFNIEDGFIEDIGAYKRYGLSTLVPDYLLLSLMGYFYGCPDMIGGGNINDSKITLDNELLIRWLEVSCTLPMMQFSYPYWNNENLVIKELTNKCISLHNQLSDEYMGLLDDVKNNNEPLARYLEYEFPHQGYEKVNDMFMIGNKFLVVPIVKKGQKEVEINFPNVCHWTNIFDGKTYEGKANFKCDIDTMLIFRRS